MVTNQRQQTFGLHDFRGVLNKFVKMLFGRDFRVDSFSDTRPLAVFSFPLRDSLRIFLPERLEGWSEKAEVFRYYKVLVAQLAARHEFGTFALNLGELPGFEGRAEQGRKALEGFVAAFEDRQLAGALLRLCEAARIDAALARRFPGLAPEISAINRALVQKLKPNTLSTALVSAALLCEAHLGLFGQLLKAKLAEFFAPLRLPGATVSTSAMVAAKLYDWIDEVTSLSAELDDEADALRSDDSEDNELSSILDEQADEDGFEDEDEPASMDDARLNGGVRRTAGSKNAASGSKRSLTQQELQRLVGAGGERDPQQASTSSDERGAPVPRSAKQQAQEELRQLRIQLAEAEIASRTGQRITLTGAADGDESYYAYDEWDYKAAEYRRGWCRLREIKLSGDQGEFYRATLARYSRLVPIIRRHFQRVRPEALRMVRGLEDGEELDLDRSVEARVERRLGQIPDPRLYKARQKEVRDVATLFLLDMSASTDEPVNPRSDFDADVHRSDDWAAPWHDPGTRRRPRRIIDINKEALVIMAQALEELGDLYAIMGFSGHGRYNVEFYVIKEFDWPLDDAVKARIGAIEPKRSTRMGTAIRHAREKFKNVNARSRHLFLLSDGFPQDFDYGEDSRSYLYGLQDTMVALRELEMSGTMPFCITVDRSGHDYLRQMCRPSRYLVIEDISSLPRELPKIYEQVVRW